MYCVHCGSYPLVGIALHNVPEHCGLRVLKQIVKNFLAALGRRDKQELLALSAEDIEWIVPGENWPLAGTHRGHAGLEDLFRRLTKRWKPRTESSPSS